MRLSNESYFSLNFIARKRQNKEGELPISLRITMNGQRAEIYINRSVRPDDWNASKGQSRGKTKKDLELNRYLIMLPQKRTGLERKIVTKKRYADMGNNSRKQHGPEFKAKVALEALKEQATLPELEKKFGVSQYTISRWKNELLRNASQTFGATNDEEAHQKEVDNLHRKIGELEMMLDFAKRASRKLGVRLPEDL